MNNSKELQLTTSYPYLWVLVRHNGQVEGQRPRTVLAFIHEAIAERGRILGFRVTKFPGDKATKHPTRIATDAVVHEFRVRPFEMPDHRRLEEARRLGAKKAKRLKQVRANA